MGEKKVSPASQPNDRNEHHKLIDPAFTKFFTQAPQKLQKFLKVRLRRPEKVEEGKDSEVPVVRKEQKSSTNWEANLEKQMQIWRENPFWHDQPPEIDVRVKSYLPREMIKGSFVNLDGRTCPFSMILTSMMNNQTNSFNVLTLGTGAELVCGIAFNIFQQDVVLEPWSVLKGNTFPQFELWYLC